MNSEQEVKWQFLDEAQEYVQTLETGFLNLSRSFEAQKWEEVLRAAHSLKGGGAMLGYGDLSLVAHRLEDFLKLIQVSQGATVNREVETLLLGGVDLLGQILSLCRQQIEIAPDWLESHLSSILIPLEKHLGVWENADNLELLQAENGEDIAVFLFQTEVNSLLERLEGVLSSDTPCLREEFTIVAQELGALGEMLDLPNFTLLCSSMHQSLTKAADEDLPTLAALVLQEWQRCQALILFDQREGIPREFVGLGERETAPPLAEISAVTEDLGDRDNIIRVAGRQVQELEDLIGELTIERSGLNLQLGNLQELFWRLRQRVQALKQSHYGLRTLYD